MKNMKSPGASSYISSAKKALIQEDEYDEEPIKFELSEKHEADVPASYSDFNLNYFDKENLRNENSNIVIERFKGDEVPRSQNQNSKNFVNVTKLETYEAEHDYNLLDSPDRSHKHSKSRSRTKEKRGNLSDEGDDNYVQMLDLNQLNPQSNEKQFLTNVKRKLENSLSLPKSPSENPSGKNHEIEETAKSLEWIIAKDLDKRQRDQVSKLIGDEDADCDQNINAEDDSKVLEIEEVKRVHFGNSMIRNNNVGIDYQDNSNLGQYVECLESVESSNDNSVRAVNEKEMLKDRGKVTEYLTDEILSMMLFNDIHD